MKTQNPWMGRAKGSAGGMTASKVYDKNVLKAKAFEVNNPNTAAQQMQRKFFAEATKISNSFSEELLRTLFGQMPKGRSRRSELAAQLMISSVTSLGEKHVNFAGIKQIGNGVKMNVAITHIESATSESVVTWNASDLNIPSGKTPNVLFVVMNKTKGTISVVNSSTLASAGTATAISVVGLTAGDEAYIYPTIEVNGESVGLRGFGSFIIKTRAEKTTKN